MKTASEIKAVFDLLYQYGHGDIEVDAEGECIILDLEHTDPELAVLLEEAGCEVNVDGWWVLRIA